MECKLCGGHNSVSLHHIFGGKNRSRSELYGMKIPLCFTCHRKVHDEPSQELNNSLKLQFQKKLELEFVDIYCCDKEQARAKFIAEFGRNYDI